MKEAKKSEGARVLDDVELGGRAEQLNRHAHRAHEADAFVRRWRADVYRVCLMITGRPESAEDAAQDALLRAVRKLPEVEVMQSEWAWLRVIAIRRALTHVKRQKFWKELDEFQPGKPDGSDERLAVEHTLSRLKPDHRLILGLALGEGMTQTEIAAALDIPEGTAASRLYAARHAFRKIWEEE